MTAQRRSRTASALVKRLSKSPSLALAVSLVTLLAGAATIAAFVLPRSGSGPDETPPSPQPTSVIDGSRSPTDDAGAANTSDDDTCLLAGESVGCRQAHDGEVIGSSSECTHATFIRHLGGAPDIDVLRPDVRVGVFEVRGDSVCVVTFSQQVRGSIRDAFAGGEHGQWRWCRDTKRREAAVSCLQPHDAEVVALRRTSDEQPPECYAAAAAYAETTWRRLGEAVSVEAIEVNSTPGCQVEALGANQLTASIRGIGTRTLPVTPIRS